MKNKQFNFVESMELVRCLRKDQTDIKVFSIVSLTILFLVISIVLLYLHYLHFTRIHHASYLNIPYF